jgi:8-oxo-dGTP diphosphatase
MNPKTFLIRCRAIIVYDNKLLIVKHSIESKFYAIPGGHLEWGEEIQEALKREVVEELGIEPQIGRLLYINNFTEEDERQSIEFFFEITNAKDYLDIDNLGGTHKFELVEIKWASKEDNYNILPEQIQIDLKNNTILSNTIRFIK